MKPTIGIVGYGDFARLMIRELSPYFDIFVSTRREAIPGTYNRNFVELDVVLAQEIIIPSMPSQFLEKFFKENASKINPNALIIDICSVKVKPVEVLSRLLPKSCDILATHPMFGPFSAENGVAGLQIMVHPTRISEEKYQKIKKFLSEDLKLKIIECTPEEHDEQLAYVLGLTQYIGRAVQKMDIPDTELKTVAYEDLMDMKRIQGTDSWELFESIMKDNPYAKDVNDKLKNAMKELDEKLQN